MSRNRPVAGLSRSAFFARWRLSRAVAASAPITTAEANAKEGVFALRRWTGMEERRRLTALAEVMMALGKACTKSGWSRGMLQRVMLIGDNRDRSFRHLLEPCRTGSRPRPQDAPLPSHQHLGKRLWRHLSIAAIKEAISIVA